MNLNQMEQVGSVNGLIANNHSHTPYNENARTMVIVAKK